jgi:hypothetical protein
MIFLLAIAILAIGYAIAQTIRAVVTRLLSSSKLAWSAGQWTNTRKTSPVEFAGRLTFCFTMLVLLLVFSDVLNLLVMCGGISTMPICGPGDDGLLPISFQGRPQAVSRCHQPTQDLDTATALAVL